MTKDELLAMSKDQTAKLDRVDVRGARREAKDPDGTYCTRTSLWARAGRR